MLSSVYLHGLKVFNSNPKPCRLYFSVSRCCGFQPETKYSLNSIPRLIEHAMLLGREVWNTVYYLPPPLPPPRPRNLLQQETLPTNIAGFKTGVKTFYNKKWKKTKANFKRQHSFPNSKISYFLSILLKWYL